MYPHGGMGPAATTHSRCPLPGGDELLLDLESPPRCQVCALCQQPDRCCLGVVALAAPCTAPLAGLLRAVRGRPSCDGGREVVIPSRPSLLALLLLLVVTGEQAQHLALVRGDAGLVQQLR